jgi:uncharacterized protein (DUF2267 family)
VIDFVRRVAAYDRERADRAVRATLQTLAERISAGEARQLAEQLPPELAPSLGSDTHSQPFDMDDFVRRLAAREEVDPDTAERDARIVFAALAHAVDQKELDDLASELDKTYAPLLPRGPYVEVLPAGEFLHRVAERAGVDEAGARRATEAVLETLAERIAEGEVDDLHARLPRGLHAPLRVGLAHSGGVARRMSFDEFAARVAEREGAPLLAAREHAAAVLATLREAVGDDEFFDVTVQLPADYPRAAVRSG